MKLVASIILLLGMGLAGQTFAEPVQITIEMGDYRFHPDRLEVPAGQEIELRLTNTDKITPHNFILKAPEAGLAIAVDVSPGATETVVFTPTKPGFYPFHCSKRLLFFKSHRERGMHGFLVVSPESGQ